MDPLCDTRHVRPEDGQSEVAQRASIEAGKSDSAQNHTRDEPLLVQVLDFDASARRGQPGNPILDCSGVTTNQGPFARRGTPQIFRTLAPDHAVALLSVGGVAFDDVIRVPQLTNDDLL